MLGGLVLRGPASRKNPLFHAIFRSMVLLGDFEIEIVPQGAIDRVASLVRR